ncbi:MAG: PTS mannose transporter subunit IIC [Deltaproteobacteria bacterium]|nr:PTS mannose transporter subunit IIC [Deltaproteobacteria bacterium]
MIGIILCCHADMGTGIKSAAELIIGPQENFLAIGINPEEGLDDLKKKLKKAIRTIGGDGVLILTDIPGGTPFNVSAMLMNDKIKMISGFNLPLLIKILMERHIHSDIKKLTHGAAQYAAEHVIDAEVLLNSQKSA